MKAVDHMEIGVALAVTHQTAFGDVPWPDGRIQRYERRLRLDNQTAPPL
jgi:hypothetical protein